MSSFGWVEGTKGSNSALSLLINCKRCIHRHKQQWPQIKANPFVVSLNVECSIGESWFILLACLPPLTALTDVAERWALWSLYSLSLKPYQLAIKIFHSADVIQFWCSLARCSWSSTLVSFLHNKYHVKECESKISSKYNVLQTY